MRIRRASLLVPLALVIVLMVPLSPRSVPPTAATWYYSHDGMALVINFPRFIVLYSFQIDANGNAGRNYMTTEQHNSWAYVSLGYWYSNMVIHYGSDVYDYVWYGTVPGYRIYNIQCGGCYTTMDFDLHYLSLPPIHYHLECGVGVG